MIADRLAFGGRVVWQGHQAEIIDIAWKLHATRVRIRIPLAQPRTRWVPAAELAEPAEVSR